MEIEVNTKQKDYKITIARGSLKQLSKYMDVHKKAFIISDEGVPKTYYETVASQLDDYVLHVVAQGESSKSLATYEECLKIMLENNFSRNDVVIAVGGGVVGDLAGFVASSYMRGINFINIPTTTLSQIDSSIGGKTGVNLAGVKNIVGAFWQPTAVIIDPDVLDTLTARHYNNGLVEAVKAGLLHDESLFELFENNDPHQVIEEILYKSLMFKKEIVEQDERENGIRKILNFGHTIGHGYESYYHLHDYYHGECVALGMMAIISNPNIKERLAKVLNKLNIATKCDADYQKVYQFIINDKKANHDKISIILVDEIGKANVKEIPMINLLEIVKEAQTNE